MTNITFFSSYPTEKDMQDGFFVRVKNIDDIFANEKRTYLAVSLRQNLTFNVSKPSPNLTVVQANVFLHYFKIRKLLKTSETYYVQSLYNYLWATLFSIKKTKKIVWDVHGAVPEELAFYGKNRMSRLFNWCEKKLANRASFVVSVTKSMLDYLLEKHPKMTKNSIVYPIINKQLLADAADEQVNNLRKELDIKTNETVFIYSGSLIKWQRFDDILETIKKLENPNYRFIILTGQIEDAKQKIAENNLTEKIILRTAKPEELPNYYSLAHAGFILRDEHVLNKVAAPTKLLEYMYYGLMPIVDYEKIGDFFDLGYEFVKYDAISNTMQPIKSKKNSEIITSMFANKQEKQFHSLVLQDN